MNWKYIEEVVAGVTVAALLALALVRLTAPLPPDRGAAPAASIGVAPAGVVRAVPRAPAGRLAAPPASPAVESRPAAAADPVAAARAAAGDRSIGGRIFLPDGASVAGISVIARRYAPGAGLLFDYAGARFAQSDASGYFEFDALVPGDYEVRNLADGRYPSSGRLVRAGFQEADLILRANTTVRLYGMVSDRRGTPLAGVQVRATGQAMQVRTDENGRYQMPLVVRADERYTIYFRAVGYDTRSRIVPGAAEHPLDMALTRTGATTSLAGTVRSTYGAPLAGIRVVLEAADTHTRHTALSDASGAFQIGGVKPEADYLLAMHPPAGYRDQASRPLRVSAGMAPLELVLAPLATGQVYGNMMDAQGFPLARISLRVGSDGAPDRAIKVAGDDQGYFALDAVPVGRLTFATQAPPLLSVTGITLAPDGQQQVALVLDVGRYSLTGVVREPAGAPLAGARVTLEWSARIGRTRSHSMRSIRSDQLGRYRFEGLGPGLHRLRVVSSRYRPLAGAFNAGTDAPRRDLVLAPTAP